MDHTDYLYVRWRGRCYDVHYNMLTAEVYDVVDSDNDIELDFDELPDQLQTIIKDAVMCA